MIKYEEIFLSGDNNGDLAGLKNVYRFERKRNVQEQVNGIMLQVKYRATLLSPCEACRWLRIEAA